MDDDMTWQPIETAPKDGWVLLYSPDNGGQQYVASWECTDYNSEPEWAYGPSGYEHSFRHPVYGATHWMPLPEPPK